MGYVFGSKKPLRDVEQRNVRKGMEKDRTFLKHMKQLPKIFCTFAISNFTQFVASVCY